MLHNGKQIALPVVDEKDHLGAWNAFQALLNAEKSQSTATRPEPLATLTDAFLDSRSHRIADKTRRDYGILLRHFTALYGNRAAADVDGAEVEKHAAVRGWSDSHRANYLYIVQAFLRWCGRKDFTLSRPAKESRGDCVVSPDHYARILRETTGDFHQYVRVLWLTGARPMEITRLEVESMDWQNDMSILKLHKNKKKGKKRVIYFPVEAMGILREQSARHGDGPLFRGQRGAAFTCRALVDRFKRLSKKTGQKVRSYDFRHSYITRSLLKGTPVATVAALVGTSIGMIDRFYGHVQGAAGPLREAAQKTAG